MKTNNLTKEDVKKLLGAKNRKKFEWSKGDIRKKKCLHLQKQYG